MREFAALLLALLRLTARGEWVQEGLSPEVLQRLTPAEACAISVGLTPRALVAERSATKRPHPTCGGVVAGDACSLDLHQSLAPPRPRLAMALPSAPIICIYICMYACMYIYIYIYC